MKPYTFTLILLFAGLHAFGQLRQGDVTLSFSDRMYLSPIPAPAGLSDQLSGIRTYPGTATVAHIAPKAFRMVSERLGVGGQLIVVGGLGGGFPLIASLAPAVRYYFHNDARRMWYGSLGPTFLWNDTWSYGVQLGGGLQIPVASSVLFSPNLVLDYGGERVIPVLEAGIELLLGNNRGPAERRAPELHQGSFLLGASSFQLSAVKDLQNWSMDLSAHYFVLRRFALSGRVLANVSRLEADGENWTTAGHIEPGIGLRYYWNAGQSLLWFTDVAIDFGTYSSGTLAGGVNYFVGQHLALEYGLYLQSSLDNNPVFGQSFGMRLYWGQ
ncbi:hypothetical protein [Lewinella sp. IMCC34191]|uniref:hypothetical protein n=1 Tax=Lewinella sp. IMCC34191 TaxID=2259172 RepID=UPI000E242134|nr:hypothetical protein [Lewinella sp. IMCC34191]